MKKSQTLIEELRTLSGFDLAEDTVVSERSVQEAQADQEAQQNAGDWYAEKYVPQWTDALTEKAREAARNDEHTASIKWTVDRTAHPWVTHAMGVLQDRFEGDGFQTSTTVTNNSPPVREVGGWEEPHSRASQSVVPTRFTTHFTIDWSAQAEA